MCRGAAALWKSLAHKTCPAGLAKMEQGAVVGIVWGDCKLIKLMFPAKGVDVYVNRERSKP